MFSLKLLELHNGHRKCQDKWVLPSGQRFVSCSLDNCWPDIAWGKGGEVSPLVAAPGLFSCF